LKPEWWGSPLAQEKYQRRKKTCDKKLLLLLLLLSPSSSFLVTGFLSSLVLLLLRLQVSACSTFLMMCDVPSMAVFCKESIECCPGIVSR
jgi:hypothetical protein